MIVTYESIDAGERLLGYRPVPRVSSFRPQPVPQQILQRVLRRHPAFEGHVTDAGNGQAVAVGRFLPTVGVTRPCARCSVRKWSRSSARVIDR